jgi:hypothetical protein
MSIVEEEDPEVLPRFCIVGLYRWERRMLANKKKIPVKIVECQNNNKTMTVCKTQFGSRLSWRLGSHLAGMQSLSLSLRVFGLLNDWSVYVVVIVMLLFESWISAAVFISRELLSLRSEKLFGNFLRFLGMKVAFPPVWMGVVGGSVKQQDSSLQWHQVQIGSRWMQT